MKKPFGKAAIFAMVLAGGVFLASCQVSPVNANTIITNAQGAGSKELSMFCLVDGSVQISADSESFPGNTNYFYIDDATFANPSFTPKENNFVSYINDGYFTNPNKLTTPTAIWEEFNNKVKASVPTGFEFSVSTVKSSGWKDEYMSDTAANRTNTTNEWKAYVYHVSYEWNNVEEYISKTKTLIGSKYYATSELAELDDASTPWASITKGENNTYTWKECYTVNYWSAYGIVDTVLDSNLFNRDALGSDYHIDTSSAFTVGMQQYKIGESDAVKVKVDNTSTTDASGNVKFIEASGTITEPAKTGGCGGSIIATSGIVAALALGGIGFAVYKKKKK